MNILMDVYERNKSKLQFSLVAAFFWGLVAHGYRYLNSDFTHDSLKELHGGILGNRWKVELGRVFVPFYRSVVRSDVTVPWLIGLLTLLMLGLTVFVLIKIFHIDSKGMIFLTAGIVTANRSITAITATYMHDLDCYALSILLVTSAVYVWKQHKWGFLPGAVLLAGALGFYQSYISVTITLVMIICILQLLEGDKFSQVLDMGMRAVAMLLIGGGMYYVAMKLVQRALRISMATGGYNTLDITLSLTPEMIVRLTGEAYRDCIHRFLYAYSTYPVGVVKGITILLLLISGGILLVKLADKKVTWPAKILCIVLLFLLPFGMNLLYVMANGTNHDLMVYAIWMMYLLIMLLGCRFTDLQRKSGWACRGLICVLITLLLYGNVQFANGLYLKKGLEYDAYLSLMTRVTYRMEEQEGYVPGETAVYFAGLPENLNKSISGFENYRNIIGGEKTDVISIGKRERYQIYYNYVLGTPIRLVEEDRWNQFRGDSRILDMPSYPADGCIAEVDGVLVVKLGNHWD